MTKTIKRFIGLTVAALALTCGFTVVSVAIPDIAKAGGNGDFYWYKTCSPTGRSYLVGKLSNYDIHNFADQRYHHGTPSSLVGSWQLAYVLYDDESWPITTSEIWDAMAHSGTKVDGTQDFDIKSTQHIVKFIWSNGRSSATCSIRG